MKTVLRTVVSELELAVETPEPERPTMRHITFVPANGARAVGVGRRSLSAPAAESLAVAG